jgi:hypothetical protein
MDHVRLRITSGEGGNASGGEREAGPSTMSREGQKETGGEGGIRGGQKGIPGHIQSAEKHSEVQRAESALRMRRTRRAARARTRRER